MSVMTTIKLKKKKRIELQITPKLAKAIEDIFNERKLKSFSVVEQVGKSDIHIYYKGKRFFFIECKDPIAPDGMSVHDSDVLIREIKRARKLEVEAFGVCNFIEALFFCYTRTEDYDAFERPFFSLRELDSIRNNLSRVDLFKNKLLKIGNWYVDIILEFQKGELEPLKPIDERFVTKLRSLIDSYSWHIIDGVWDEFNRNTNFKREVKNYFRMQEWTIPTEKEDIENFVRIALLLITSKLIFYKAMHDSGSWNLPKLIIAKNIRTAKQLERYLWTEYFLPLIRITKDFELLIGDRAAIIEVIPFMSVLSVSFVKSIVDSEGKFDFSKLSFDIIGKIFEELIKDEQRHTLGQYFTPSTVVDFINSYCIKSGDEKILDSSCGSGTFLVRAYDRKRKLKEKSHTENLSELYGVDISSYASYLSMLNLSIRDLKFRSYPRIIHKDFFEIGFKSKEQVRDINGEINEVEFSGFDSVVGNPPYTRQEEIDTFKKGEKAKILHIVGRDWGIKPSRRSSIYAYFFYHGGKFLKAGGYLGLITNNSWLDTDYGDDLQKWMLSNFQIVAIIDSKVERFFPSADVNTVITILRQESSQKNRDENLVKFIYLNRKLTDIYAKVGDADALKNIIEDSDEFYEDSYLRVRPVKQGNLSQDNKWGKYARAPKIYWKLMTKGAMKLIKLSDGVIKEVRRGFTSGENKFFYLKDKTDSIDDTLLRVVRNNFEKIKKVKDVRGKQLRVMENGWKELWLIEEQLLSPLVKSSKEIHKYEIELKKLHYKCLLCNLATNFRANKTYDINAYRKFLKAKMPYVWRYITHGEKIGLDTEENPTCHSRPAWWDLGGLSVSQITTPMSSDSIHPFVLNKKGIPEDNRLYGIIAKRKDVDKIFNLLNSTFCQLQIQVRGRVNFGLGVLDYKVYEIYDLLVPELNKLRLSKGSKFNCRRPYISIFEELGSDTPNLKSLDSVKSDRLTIDNAILKAIGYTNSKRRNAVLLELYNSIIDMVKARHDKVKSVESRRKKKKVEIKIYVEELIEMINETATKPVKHYQFAELLTDLVKQITPDIKLQRKILNKYWQITFGEPLKIKDLQKALQATLL